MGELMRRHRQVVGLSRDATSTRRRIRLLGEDPKNLCFDPDAPPLKLTAGGNWSSRPPLI